MQRGKSHQVTRSHSPGGRWAGFMMLIKFIRFPLPVSPGQLPAATVRCWPHPPRNCQAPQHPAAHHRAMALVRSLGGIHVCSGSPKPVSPQPQPRPSLFPASTALPSRAAGPHSHPLTALLPPAIRSAPGVPRQPVLERQGQAGSGQDCKALRPPHSCAVLCHPGWEGTLPEPRG